MKREFFACRLTASGRLWLRAGPEAGRAYTLRRRARQAVANFLDRDLMAESGELTRIAKRYGRALSDDERQEASTSNRPSEHETVAYLVVPLLRALGWTPQRMAVEWHKVGA